MLKRLISASSLYPNCIISNQSKQLKYSESGELMPYSGWNKNIKRYSSHNIVQIGIGGVLYPPNSLHELVLRSDLFCKLAPMADDLWLNAMARLNGTQIVQSGRQVLPLPILNNSPKLSTVNAYENNMNDQQIVKIREWLKENGIESNRP